MEREAGCFPDPVPGVYSVPNERLKSFAPLAFFALGVTYASTLVAVWIGAETARLCILLPCLYLLTVGLWTLALQRLCKTRLTHTILRQFAVASFALVALAVVESIYIGRRTWISLPRPSLVEIQAPMSPLLLPSFTSVWPDRMPAINNNSAGLSNPTVSTLLAAIASPSPDPGISPDPENTKVKITPFGETHSNPPHISHIYTPTFTPEAAEEAETERAVLASENQWEHTGTQGGSPNAETLTPIRSAVLYALLHLDGQEMAEAATEAEPVAPGGIFSQDEVTHEATHEKPQSGTHEKPHGVNDEANDEIKDQAKVGVKDGSSREITTESITAVKNDGAELRPPWGESEERTKAAVEALLARAGFVSGTGEGGEERVILGGLATTHPTHLTGVSSEATHTKAAEAANASAGNNITDWVRTPLPIIPPAAAEREDLAKNTAETKRDDPKTTEASGRLAIVEIEKATPPPATTTAATTTAGERSSAAVVAQSASPAAHTRVLQPTMVHRFRGPMNSRWPSAFAERRAARDNRRVKLLLILGSAAPWILGGLSVAITALELDRRCPVCAARRAGDLPEFVTAGTDE